MNKSFLNFHYKVERYCIILVLQKIKKGYGAQSQWACIELSEIALM